MAGVVYAQISLSVNAIPKRVEVLLDGNSIGTTPIRKNTITPGSHMFKIEKEGYAPINYDIVVNPSKAINLDFFMNPGHQKLLNWRLGSRILLKDKLNF